MSDIKLEAWARWQAAAGAWRGWAICPALTMPTDAAPTDVAPTDVARTESGWSDVDVEMVELVELVEALASTTLAGAPTALAIDLDPVLGVHLAAALNQRALASVVLLLPRWPHADAVLPSGKLIWALVDASRHVRRCPSAQHVVFVLDGERSKSIVRPTIDSRIDNRYDLAVSDLPTLRQLRCAGVERIVKLSPSASA